MAKKIYKTLKMWGVKENPTIVMAAIATFVAWLTKILCIVACFYVAYIGIWLISGLA